MITGNFELDAAMGSINGISYVHKFGRNADIDQAIEDIWDGGGVWVPPTTARTHSIVSSDAADTNTAGAGARKIKISGLVDWSSEGSASEVIELNGTTPVSTVNSYVIIHRMFVAESGDSINTGTITATADTDATVTASILAGEGQTQMAIFGIPDGHTALMSQFYASSNRSTTSGSVDLLLKVNSSPQDNNAFTTKHAEGLQLSGSSSLIHKYSPYKKFNGPCIVKMSAIGSANGNDVSAGFDMIIVKEI